MNELWQQILGEIDGGRVLDIGTGDGGFARLLSENLARYDEIIGVDGSKHAIEAAQRLPGHAACRFVQMDVERLVFRDNSFDTVSMSAVLHHLVDIARVLDEAGRVLKPGGRFILAEMHRDGATEAQLTTIYLHHWVAAVDQTVGKPHFPTLERSRLVECATALGLRDVAYHDISDTKADPMNSEMMDTLTALIERTAKRAAEAPAGAELVEQGKVLGERLRIVGAQREPVLVLVGVKGSEIVA
jgi:2-polyprenyl-3-methyl-5-hydroxy-6-metoxy-1,4-benzoquinol methylase